VLEFPITEREEAISTDLPGFVPFKANPKTFKWTEGEEAVPGGLFYLNLCNNMKELSRNKNTILSSYPPPFLFSTFLLYIYKKCNEKTVYPTRKRGVLTYSTFVY
jgi:hypothetical protein